jgi:hypothetical protein
MWQQILKFILYYIKLLLYYIYYIIILKTRLENVFQFQVLVVGHEEVGTQLS